MHDSLFPAILRFCSDILMPLILSFEDGGIHEVDHEETSPAQIVRRFLTKGEDVLKELRKETPSLFNGPE